MDIINTHNINLEYGFKAEELIASRRIPKEALEEIKNWILNHKNKYVPSRLQDETIMIFLLSCNNDVELTKKVIINFYNFKKEGPELYNNRDVNRTDLKAVLDILYLSSIPVRMKDNTVIHYFHIHDSNYRKFDFTLTMMLTLMLIDISQEKNPPDGLVVLLDLEGVSIMHLTKMKLLVLRKYFKFLQEAMPIKIKGIHVINAVYFMDKLMAIIKTVTKHELLNMIHIHQPGLEQEKLFEIIPKECLPKEYGGDLPSKQELHQITIEQFEKKQTFWKAEEQLRQLALGN